MTKPNKYVAEISQVREVALHGTADLTFWSERLQPKHLAPSGDDGEARLVFTAVDAKYKGVRFGELSIGVFACAEWNIGHEEGIYLVHAFNSSRLFTICERRFFHTPYVYANIRLEAGIPASIEANSAGQRLLRAQMRACEEREPGVSTDESWEGPIYLPRSKPSAGSQRRLFWAKLSGQSRAYEFSDTDSVMLGRADGHPILEWLNESGFKGKRWSIRWDATHARSKTVSIDD